MFPNNLPDAVEEAAVFGLGGALVMDKLHLRGDDVLVLAEPRRDAMAPEGCWPPLALL